jgi:hypothetical protein
LRQSTDARTRRWTHSAIVLALLNDF